MPNRIIKESICTSDNIDQLSAFQETMFYRLIVNCDDFGRFDGRPKIIASKLFPLKDIRVQQIEDGLRALTSAELVILYEVDGKPFLQMKTWDRHQQIRAKKSKYPAPGSNGNQDVNICKQMISDVSKCPRNPIQSESESNPNPYPNPRQTATAETPFGTIELDPLIIKVQKELNGLTDTHYQRLEDFRQYLGDELVSFAIDAAVGNGVRNWNYVEAILKGYEKDGIRTVGEAKARAEKRKEERPQRSGAGKVLNAQKFSQRDYTEDELKSGSDDQILSEILKARQGTA